MRAVWFGGRSLELLDNDLTRWLGATVSIISSWLAITFGAALIRAQSAKRATGHGLWTLISGMLERTHQLLPLGLSLLLLVQWLAMSEALEGVLEGTAAVALGAQAGLYLGGALNFFLARQAAMRAEQREVLTSFAVLKVIGHVMIWLVVIIVVLANLGVNVTGLVASLGVGGIAVALAAQKILGDVFASISIVLDRPFEVGDFIAVGDFMGTVERIGMKTTRVRGLGGEQQVFANADLLESRIRNFQRLSERRVVFTIGLCFGSPVEKLRQVPDLAKRAVEAQQQVRFDRAHLARFSESSIDFEIVYYVLQSDFNAYMDVQQAIYFSLYESVHALGLDFAFPTRTLHLDSVPERFDPRFRSNGASSTPSHSRV
jgi:small-conductance mechanosensitive channel